ncbi:hypothetical protein K504DRAFT_505324 [Pleomassaria siparia CBS 279.74]|uniref:G-patch domain-containing protein n=1 Tax=Pleomassaria siparia CBS 279.74 TaxID=1314801 RepID=A0A6G1K1W5_9PLEO|nr:hypothetical protein K504DRAFT_505324 [Pleomassaria siparia CBS 279.74]
MDRPNLKRKAEDAPKKSSGLSGGFGARMLAKMGFVEGQGLGKDGTGISEPIQVRLRTAKAGIGASGESELTQQQKRQAKKNAEAKGEVWEDDDVQVRKKRHTDRKSGASTPRVQYTIQDLEKAGLSIPPSFKLLDMTGAKAVALSGLDLRLQGSNPSYNSRTSADLTSYGNAWTEIANEANDLETQEIRLQQQMRELEKEIQAARLSLDATEGLKQLHTLEDILSYMENKSSILQDEAIIAAIHKPLAAAMSSSDLLHSSETVTTALARIQSMLSTNTANTGTAKRRTTPYESLICHLVLPGIRTAILQWDPLQPAAMTLLIRKLQPILPNFVLSSIESEVQIKVREKLNSMSFKSIRRGHWNSKEMPSFWVLPLFEVIQPDKELLLVLRGKLRLLLQLWDVSRGPFPSYGLYHKALPDLDRLACQVLLPKLASLIRDQLVINPVDQELEIIETFFKFENTFKPEVLAEVLAQHFFPQFDSILFQWLTSSPNYSEISQWYVWWKSLFSDAIARQPSIQKAFEASLSRINRALDGSLEPLEQSTPTPEPVDTPSKEPPRPRVVEEMTFKDIVEEWCGDENLLLVPLREAHPTTGSPIYKITASAVGGIGVRVYLRGDVLYAADKKDKSKWNPIELGTDLIARAEGK